MNSEQKLDLVADRIKRDALTQGIDFADPTNAFTVWADLSHRMQYCGSRRALDDAWMLAADHTNLKDLYVVKGPISAFGIMEFEKG
jgi:hypothetical protein